MKTSRIRFSFLLPVLELTVWVVLILVPATLLFLQYRSEPGLHRIGIIDVTIPRDHLLPFAAESAAIRYLEFFCALDFPGMIGEVLVSLPTSWPASWHPAGISLQSWRPLSLPFYSLPAWWLVGRGLDALISRRRMHWLLGVSGSLLCLLCIVVLCGLWFGVPDRDDDGAWIFWGLGLWGMGFGVLPVAWLRQRRLESEIVTVAS
jgi:hypothetical protein